MMRRRLLTLRGTVCITDHAPGERAVMVHLEDAIPHFVRRGSLRPPLPRHLPRDLDVEVASACFHKQLRLLLDHFARVF